MQHFTLQAEQHDKCLYRTTPGAVYKVQGVVVAKGDLEKIHRCLYSKGALVHESELARNEPDSQVYHLPRAYDNGLASSAIRLRM